MVFPTPVVLDIPASKPQNVFSVLGSRRPESCPFTLTLNAVLSVVPMKLVPSTVPALPVRLQPPDTGGSQVPKPNESVVSTLPAATAPAVICNRRTIRLLKVALLPVRLPVKTPPANGKYGRTGICPATNGPDFKRPEASVVKNPAAKLLNVVVPFILSLFRVLTPMTSSVPPIFALPEA